MYQINDMANSKKSKKTGGKEKSKPKSPGEKFYTEHSVHLKEAYADFVRWSILTKLERKAEKAPDTQGQFATKWNIAPDTIVDWKKRADYPKLRGEAFRGKLAAEIPEVMADLRKRIKKYGIGLDVELYLAYAEGWDKKKVVEIKPTNDFGPGDIRALLAKLPKEKQKLYYGTLAKLIADATDADDNL